MVAGLDRVANFIRKFRRDPFIRVNFKNPIARAGIETCVAAVAFDIPRPFDEILGKECCDRIATVGAFV